MAKSITIIIVSILFISCNNKSKNINYYLFPDKSITTSSNIQIYLDSVSNFLPEEYKERYQIQPLIFHKIKKKDSIINFLKLNLVEKNENKSNIDDYEFVQDSLFLFLNREIPRFSLRNIFDEEVSSENLKGKPTLINFWSIACAPCIAEFPILEKIKEKYKDQINFIALTENTSKEVISFLKKRNFSYYVLVNTFKYQELVLKINSLPTNIILDKNGIIKDISGSIPLDPMSLKYNSTNIEKTLNSLIK